VKPPGPRISKVELVEPGLPDDGPDVGDLIAVTFDQPTSRASNMHGAVAAVNGTLGKAEFESTWNGAGDTLILRIERQVGRYATFVTTGTCLDNGFFPIGNEKECVSSAYSLGLSNLTVTAVSEANEPEGCFYLEGQTVFFNSHPDSAGRGAEASSPGFPRLPLCTLRA